MQGPRQVMDERTRLIRSATAKGGGRRTVNPPVERGTTLVNDRVADVPDASKGPVYGIEGLGVQRALEAAIAELEGAKRVFLVPTGLAAVTVACTALLRPGDEVLLTDAAYGPTRRYFERHMKTWDVEVRFYEPNASADEILALAGSQTRMLFLEQPGSLTFDLLDAPAATAAAKAKGLTTVMDATWSAGVLFKPLARGVDVSVQALSKYAGGHSDVFMGSIATNDDRLARRIANAIEDLGWYVSPDDAWLVLRGLRTLPVRIAEHGRNALQVAEWLERQPQVARVLYPALPSHPGHEIWKRDYAGASGLMGVVLKPGGKVEAILDGLQLFGLGYSWGGFESLATWEDRQLHRRVAQADLGGPLIRLHIGLESADDLIADLAVGLSRYGA